MENEEEMHDKYTGMKPCIIKVNVPLRDEVDFLEWKEDCRKKEPIGFSDYHWGKMKHDHIFTKEHADPNHVKIRLIGLKMLDTLLKKQNHMLSMMREFDQEFKEKISQIENIFGKDLPKEDISKHKVNGDLFHG